MSAFGQHLLKQTSPRGVSIPVPKGRLKIRAVQISLVVDSLVLILLAKMSFNLVFRNQVGVDPESAEGWCFVSGHDFSRAIRSRKKLGFSQDGVTGTLRGTWVRL